MGKSINTSGNTRKYTVFHYRYGAKEELEASLQGICRKRPIHQQMEQELLFAKISVFYLCSELLELAQMPENPYLLSSLECRYKQAKAEASKLLDFPFEALFEEGWLIRSEEEWIWNNSRYEYERMTSCSHGREEQILTFLKSLKEIPYKEAIYPEIDEKQDAFQMLLQETGVTLEWLLEEKLVEKKGGSLYINSRSAPWEMYGERVLSHKYEAWNCGENPQQLQRWIQCCEFLGGCFCPEKYISEGAALYRYCLEHLEREESSWRQEETLVSKATQIEYNHLDETYSFTVPAYGAERQNYIARHMERWCRLWDSTFRRTLYYSICVRNYQRMGREFQKRFRKILQKPCFEIQYFHLLHWENERCTQECVEEPELFIPAVCNLLHYIETNCRNKEEQRLYKMQILKPIWDICYNGVHQANSKAWILNLAELMVYLYEKGNCYRDVTYHRAPANSETEMLMVLMQYYFQDISQMEPLDRTMIEYLKEKLSQGNRHHGEKYLGLLLLLGKTVEEREETEKRKRRFYHGLYEELLCWLSQAKECDMLPSTISWDFFQEPVWHRILLMKQKNLIGFFELWGIEALKGAKQFQQKQSVILGVGRLALIGLYFLTTCLVQLRKKLPGELLSELEEIFIREFVALQSEWRLFSGENIRLARSGMVLSNCMHSLSYLTGEAREFFLTALKPEDIMDLVFWIEYVKEQSLKIQLIHLLMTVEKEQLLHPITFLPTLQQMLDKLLEICFDLDGNQHGEDAEHEEEIEQLLVFAEYVLKEFQEQMKHKPKNMQDDYRDWIDSAHCRVMLLKNQKEEIFSSQQDFYKGLVWLNSEELEEVQKAKDVFGQRKNEQSYSWWSNYLIACVLEIVKKKEEEADYSEELVAYEKEFAGFSRKVPESKKEYMRIAYLYGLFLYLSLEEREKFWHLYGQMPEEFRFDKKIAIYTMEAYLVSGETEKAKDLFDQIEEIYGMDHGMEVLQKKIEASEKKADQNPEGISKLKGNYGIKSDQLSREQMRFMLQELSNIADYFLADIMVDEAEFLLLPQKDRSRMGDKREIQIVSMVFQALKRLEEYSVNLLHGHRSATEDVYNRTMKLLFNVRENRFLGYYMEEQTQGGRTGTVYRSGEHGVGRRDLIIKRKGRTVALLEGIRLDSVKEKEIQGHIEKLRDYNAEQVPLMIIPIYAHGKARVEFWKKYTELLGEFQKNGIGGITQVEKVVDFGKSDFTSGLRCIARTYHEYMEEALQVVVYHVMIYVGE